MSRLLDPTTNYMESTTLCDLLIDELSSLADSYFSKIQVFTPPESASTKDIVKEFMEIYSSRPIVDNSGGSGFHNAFWLYISARLLNPKLIVESGVWKGHITWILEQAVPGAEIFGFDPDLSRIEYETYNVKFIEGDWLDYDLGNISPDESLVFFDCHVNHASRIRQAAEKGFKHLIFDDNPPAHKLYAYGLPPVPTENMIYNGFPHSVGNTVSWYWGGQRIEYSFDETELAESRRMIKSHAEFPDVGDLTGYGGFSFLTYTELSAEAM